MNEKLAGEIMGKLELIISILELLNKRMNKIEASVTENGKAQILEEGGGQDFAQDVGNEG